MPHGYPVAPVNAGHCLTTAYQRFNASCPRSANERILRRALSFEAPQAQTLFVAAYSRSAGQRRHSGRFDY